MDQGRLCLMLLLIVESYLHTQADRLVGAVISEGTGCYSDPICSMLSGHPRPPLGHRTTADPAVKSAALPKSLQVRVVPLT